MAFSEYPNFTIKEPDLSDIYLSKSAQFDATKVMSNKSVRWAKFVWPSQNIWTLLNFNTCIEPTLRMARTRKLTERKVILSMVSHQWRWLCCQEVVAFTKFQSNLARFMLISNQLKRREKFIGWVLILKIQYNFFIINVLDRSSIWTCRILNFEYRIFVVACLA